jgi:hypothetical protein
MPDKLFSAEKLFLIQFKLIQGQVQTPEVFSTEALSGHHLEHSLQLAFNPEEKLVKADYKVELKTESRGKNSDEASGSFLLSYVFRIENFEELSILNKKKKLLQLDSDLAYAIASISYSTSRGVLLTRLQGTPFQNFILPVINPGSLILEQELHLK